jgi:hypothetical protein
MIHHLRGTSLALAENVFITTEKGHENYEECKRLSTMCAQVFLTLFVKSQLAADTAAIQL